MLRRDFPDALKCYQCFSCTLSCPVAGLMDFFPHEIVNFLRLGMEDRALSCRAIWTCVSCGSCSLRCPNGIDVLSIMDGLRRLSVKRGVSEKESYVFHSIFLDEIRKKGRVHELSLVLKLKKAMGRLFVLDRKEIKAAFSMFLKGRLKLMPSKIRAVDEMRRIFGVRDG